jgi:hypothetical protein
VNATERIVLDRVRWRAEREAARLAAEFVRCQPSDREAVLAALEFEQWMAEACRDCEPGAG